VLFGKLCARGRDSLQRKLGLIRAKNEQTVHSAQDDALATHPINDKAKVLETLFDWCDAKARRSVILLETTTAYSQTRIVDIEPPPANTLPGGNVAYNVAAKIPVPIYSQLHQPRTISQLILGKSCQGLHNSRACFISTKSLIPLPVGDVWRDLKKSPSLIIACRSTHKRHCEIQLPISHVAQARAIATPLLGPIIGAVSISTAVIVVEVSAPVDVVVEAVPVARSHVGDCDCGGMLFHRWLRSARSYRFDLMLGAVRVVTSLLACRPVVVRLTGLSAATQYRFHVVHGPLAI